MATLKVNTLSGIGTEGPVFDGGLKFRSQNYMTLPKGDTAQRGRGRALIMGGIYPESTRMETYSLISSSNGVEFGTLSAGNNAAWGGALASSIRALIGGGNSQINNISYVEIPTLGDSIDFGNLSTGRRHATGVSNNIRGMWGGGETAGASSQTNLIDFVTIASTGDAQDFGDLNRAGSTFGGGSGSTVRGIFAGGYTTDIEYVTYTTTGNAVDFGNMTDDRGDIASNSDNIRSVFTGGLNPSRVNTIDYISISTEGNAIDFGDLNGLMSTGMGQVSSGHGGL